MNTYTKYPTEIIDIDILMARYLPTTDAIASATCAGDAGVTFGDSTINSTTKSVKQWVSGGTAGTVYNGRVTITGTEGTTPRRKVVPFKINVIAVPT